MYVEKYFELYIRTHREGGEVKLSIQSIDFYGTFEQDRGSIARVGEFLAKKVLQRGSSS